MGLSLTLTQETLMYCGACGSGMTHDILCPLLLEELAEQVNKTLSPWQVAEFVKLSREIAAATESYPDHKLAPKFYKLLNTARTATEFKVVFEKIIKKERE
jgi:hypothetical protein